MSTSPTYAIGIIMDPISSINIKKDSTFAMMLEAQHRGCPLVPYLAR
jgi:Glutathione synthase/Ribosomal protein S6 modification enzyme (glutaminyl transferase)